MQQHVIQLGVWDLISQAGWLVKLILLALIGASVVCWAVIISKWTELKLAYRQNAKFLDFFWGSKNLEEINQKTEKMLSSPLAGVFRSGYKELKKVVTQEKIADPSLEIENVQRALMRAAQSETGRLERYVGLLATTASAAPFVGLFGTVWGIMNSFQNIGATGAANLAVVAPGISEALIATAVGLAAAIPAVVAYNHFVNKIKKVATEMDCFISDLLNIIQRSLMTGGARKNGDELGA